MKKSHITNTIYFNHLSPPFAPFHPDEVQKEYQFLRLEYSRDKTEEAHNWIEL